jgi:hypothetical protein
MRLIQFETGNARHVGALMDGETAYKVRSVESTRELALLAVENQQTLEKQIGALGLGEAYPYQKLLRELKVLPPLDHPDPAHCLISGTGLTHLGSAATRDAMHQKAQQDESTLTDSMRIFKWGVEGGKPGAGRIGVQPEWFFKGDGSIMVRPGAPFQVPAFAEDGGEEPEIAGLYVIAPDGTPCRVGYALGNEFSDHVMERRNYLYLAHSKLRFCSVGPEVLIGALPSSVAGTSRILRNGRVIWEKPFASGEDNMSHSLENLEYHHFKYNQFLHPGDVHVHYFGAVTLSFADGIRTEDGDQFEIHAPAFGAPLVNRMQRVKPAYQIGKMHVI